jgi:hypothetical protein
MIGNIISLSAVCVTLLLGIAGLIANSLIQRKSNSIQIITQCRLKRRERTHEIVSELLKYGGSSFVSSLTDPEKTQTAKEIVGLVSELRALYSFSFDKDIRLVTAAFEIKEPLCNHLPQNALYPSEINEKRRLFAEIADIYLSTEWKRIKDETLGKQKNGKKRFAGWESIYAENDGYFSRSANRDIFPADKKQNNF